MALHWIHPMRQLDVFPFTEAACAGWPLCTKESSSQEHCPPHRPAWMAPGPPIRHDLGNGNTGGDQPGHIPECEARDLDEKQKVENAVV